MQKVQKYKFQDLVFLLCSDSWRETGKAGEGERGDDSPDTKQALHQVSHRLPQYARTSQGNVHKKTNAALSLVFLCTLPLPLYCLHSHYYPVFCTFIVILHWYCAYLYAVGIYAYSFSLFISSFSASLCSPVLYNDSKAKPKFDKTNLSGLWGLRMHKMQQRSWNLT